MMDQISPKPQHFKMMRIGDVRIGERHRRDLGDLGGLVESISQLGLLHPVVVTPDGTLIAGARRLRAAERLGWTEIAVTVIDIGEIVRGEYAENVHRKAFTPSEMVAIAAALEPLERAKAKERQGERTDQHLENFSRSSNGRALDKVAALAGVSRPTLVKARDVCRAAELNPETCAPIRDQMDVTGNIDRAFKQIKIVIGRQQEHANGCTVDDVVGPDKPGKRRNEIAKAEHDQTDAETIRVPLGGRSKMTKGEKQRAERAEEKALLVLQRIIDVLFGMCERMNDDDVKIPATLTPEKRNTHQNQIANAIKLLHRFRHRLDEQPQGQGPVRCRQLKQQKGG